MRFEGKSALVTGAAGGIGEVLVALLRREGARVAVSDRDSSAVEAEAHLDGDLLAAGICAALPAKLRGIRGDARFSTWLYRVAVNGAHDWRRRAGTRA